MTSSHTKHPDSHDHGLADGCPRCAEHAADPFSSLDDKNLLSLVERTSLWMRDEGDSFPRSDTERDAMRKVEFVLARVRTLQRIGVVGVR